MATTKSKKSTPVRGGSGHMFGKSGAGPQAPGGTGAKKSGKGGKFASGGKGKMFGFSGSKPAKAH